MGISMKDASFVSPLQRAPGQQPRKPRPAGGFGPVEGPRLAGKAGRTVSAPRITVFQHLLHHAACGVGENRRRRTRRSPSARR